VGKAVHCIASRGSVKRRPRFCIPGCAAIGGRRAGIAVRGVAARGIAVRPAESARNPNSLPNRWVSHETHGHPCASRTSHAQAWTGRPPAAPGRSAHRHTARHSITRPGSNGSDPIPARAIKSMYRSIITDCRSKARPTSKCQDKPVATTPGRCNEIQKYRGLSRCLIGRVDSI
jgi:hypothetical protein